MQLYVAPGPGCYEATLLLRAINHAVLQMNSRLQQSNIMPSHAWKALQHPQTCTHSKDRTHTHTNSETNSWCPRMAGLRGSKNCELLHSKNCEGLQPFQCYQWIHLQQITPGCNVFFSNSHQQLVTSLRGSAQILQLTEQCSAILGYISLSVLQYAR